MCESGTESLHTRFVCDLRTSNTPDIRLRLRVGGVRPLRTYDSPHCCARALRDLFGADHPLAQSLRKMPTDRLFVQCPHICLRVSRRKFVTHPCLQIQWKTLAAGAHCTTDGTGASLQLARRRNRAGPAASHIRTQARLRCSWGGRTWNRQGVRHAGGASSPERWSP